MIAAPESEPTCILLVDDLPGNLVSLKAVLERPDYRLVTAQSGPDALRLVLQQEFAVILLDVAMPGMDGFEVANLLKQRERSRTSPIIFVTASVGHMEWIYRAYKAGAVDYLQKPLDPEAVRSKVAVFVELFRQKQQLERQAVLLQMSERHERELELAKVRLDNERRYGRMRDEFLSVASHELRTPITALQLQLQSVERALEGGDGAGREQLAKKISAARRQGERLTMLVNSLLDVSRVASGWLDLQVEEIDLARVLHEVADRFSAEAERAGCELRVHTQGNLVGRWDKVRLEQVITNLLVNAIKYAPGAPIQLTAGTREQGVTFSVADRGIGIAKQDIERIFGRFERAVSSRHYGGLGLGLYIAGQIVQAHGGEIRVASEPGQGATFTVDLPWVTSQRVRPAEEPEEPAPPLH